MPSEYEDLVAALKQTGIPFSEYGWQTRPEGAYGVVSLDMESGSLDADGMKQDRSWEASVDVFFYRISERSAMISAVETALENTCGSAWEMNSFQHESSTGLFHIEWVCTVQDEPKAVTD